MGTTAMVTTLAPVTGRPGPLRVLLVADDPLVRAGLAHLLGRETGLQVVTEASARELEGSDHGAEVALWDAGQDPRAAVDKLAGAGGVMVPVVAMVPEGVSAGDVMAAGVVGVLRRETQGEPLREALRAAATGLVVLDPSFVQS